MVGRRWVQWALKYRHRGPPPPSTSGILKGTFDDCGVCVPSCDCECYLVGAHLPLSSAAQDGSHVRQASNIKLCSHAVPVQQRLPRRCPESDFRVQQRVLVKGVGRVPGSIAAYASCNLSTTQITFESEERGRVSLSDELEMISSKVWTLAAG